MKLRQKVTRLIAGSVLALVTAGSLQAATIDFTGATNGAPLVTGGFSFDVASIDSGNCGVLKPCLALGPGDSTVMTLVGGGAFDLTSLWFKLLGQPSALVITSYDAFDAILQSVSYNPIHNTGDTLTFAGLFDGIFKVKFTDTGKGNVRIDDLNATAVAAVPLPAAGGLLIAAMAGLGMFGRRRNELA